MKTKPTKQGKHCWCDCHYGGYGKIDHPSHCKPKESPEWAEELRLHKEVILWKSDEKIKGLTKRYMYDAEFIESLIPNLLSKQRAEMKEKIEKVFDSYRSSNQTVKGKRRFAVANFQVGARDLYKIIIGKILAEKERK